MVECRKILIDNRVGSVELADYMPPSLIKVCRLQFGDAAWVGNGADGESMVGVERKRIRDFLSSTASGRLSGHQLPGMLNTYNKTYIVLEGIWRPNPTSGVIEVRHGRAWRTLANGKRTWGYAELVGMLESMTNHCGVEVWRTSGIEETARWLLATNKWWGKEWEEHKSHKTPHAVAPTAQLTRMSPVRRVIMQVEGVGWDRSREVDKRFRSIVDMVNAPKSDWVAIDGIGKVIADKILNTFHNGGGG